MLESLQHIQNSLARFVIPSVIFLLSYNLPSTSINRLQHVQNSLARFVIPYYRLLDVGIIFLIFLQNFTGSQSDKGLNSKLQPLPTKPSKTVNRLTSLIFYTHIIPQKLSDHPIQIHLKYLTLKVPLAADLSHFPLPLFGTYCHFLFVTQSLL